jgi:hypothetical protein
LAGKKIMPPKLHLLILLGKWVGVILAGKIIMPPNLHLLKTGTCNFGRQNNHAAKITSTCFTWKTSRYNFGGQKKRQEHFPVHEIGRIDGGRGF